MPFLLCHDCYRWGEPSNDRCPECSQIMDSTRPDPPVQELHAVIGENLVRIGRAKTNRKMLPDRGTLYATTNGLYFLPHHVERVTQTIEADPPGHSLFWTVAGIAWFPLSIVLPFLRMQRLKSRKVSVECPQLLGPDDGQLLAESLMKNPGAFFVRTDSVRRIRRRLHAWLLDCRDGPVVRFRPDGAARPFHQRMQEVVESGRWQDARLGVGM